MRQAVKVWGPEGGRPFGQFKKQECCKHLHTDIHSGTPLGMSKRLHHYDDLVAYLQGAQ